MAQRLYIAKSGAKQAPTLPLDAVTRTFAVLGQRGTGKTNTAVVMVEEMARKGGHVVILDPVGAWWGITRRGEKKGVEGIVIGGEFGDVPLEETGGQLVAELVVGRHWPVVVLDLKMLRKGAQLRFMADFLEGVFHANREPLHVVFEEADRPIPQTGRSPDVTAMRTLGAAEDIVKLGRSRGLGATLVTQRPATLNKNALEVCESLFLHRLMGPNDRKAVKGWVESNGDPEALKRVMDSMASLKLGEAWLYSPGWLGLLERIRVRGRHTFDSSSTPEVGAAVQEPTERAPVNLDELREQMAATIEQAEQRDPDKLRAKIVRLEAQLEAAMAEAPEPEKILVPDREAMADLSERVAELHAFVEELERVGKELSGEVESKLEVLREVGGEARTLLEEARGTLDLVGKLPPEGGAAGVYVATYERKAESPRIPASASPKVAQPVEEGDISKGAQRLLAEMRELHPLRLSRTQLATILGRGAKSSTLTTQLAELKGAGLIDDLDGRYGVVGMENGQKWSHAELVERWRRALPAGPRQLLDALLEAAARDTPAGRNELFEAAGFSATSSTPVTHLKLLTDNGLAVKQGGMVALGPALAGG